MLYFISHIDLHVHTGSLVPRPSPQLLSQGEAGNEATIYGQEKGHTPCLGTPSHLPYHSFLNVSTTGTNWVPALHKQLRYIFSHDRYDTHVKGNGGTVWPENLTGIKFGGLLVNSSWRILIQRFGFREQ